MSSAMAPEDKLLLSPDTLIIAVADLPRGVKDRLGRDEQEGFALTRPYGRATSTLVDVALADLLGEFRSPSTVVEAVVRYSRKQGLDPDEILTKLYPALRRCRKLGYLVAPNSAQARPIEASFAVGRRMAGGTIVRCLRVLEDSELHQVALDSGGAAALKVVRPGGASVEEESLGREAAVLEHLGGDLAPSLLDRGETDDCQWLAIEWFDGVLPTRAGGTARRAPAADRELLALCVRLAEAYAELHERGVVHGDVHPGNILVAHDGAVRIIDFGLAAIVSGDGPFESPPRGGVQAYYDPEHAAASYDGRQPGPATFASDQFSLGALLYELVADAPYLNFSLDRAAMLRQIAEDEPLPFVRRGRQPWPELEQLLRTTLAKDPGKRLVSTRELAGRLSRVSPPSPVKDVIRTKVLEGVLDSVLAEVRPGGSWFEHGLPAGAPCCSVAYGAAGMAAAVYRVAVLRADPELLALADEWSVRATRDAIRDDAFTSDDLALDEDITGRVTPFHSVSGVHAVQALISHAIGDIVARQRALDAFAATSREPCDNVDLTLGQSGTLLAAAILLEAIADARYADLTSLTELGNRTLAGLWDRFDAMPPVSEAGELSILGIAHGWAGVLLASLRWCRAADVRPPVNLVDRLDQLALLAQPAGLGVRWPLDNHPGGGPSMMPGWCHGSAGYVHLWTTAHETLRDERWATLAEQSASDAYATPNRIAQLCCGQAGQAYGLLALYRHSGERRWLTAASELATRAATGSATLTGLPTAASLHKGITGIAVLAADIAGPEAAAMPFFGEEG